MSALKVAEHELAKIGSLSEHFNPQPVAASLRQLEVQFAAALQEADHREQQAEDRHTAIAQKTRTRRSGGTPVVVNRAFAQLPSSVWHL